MTHLQHLTAKRQAMMPVGALSFDIAGFGLDYESTAGDLWCVINPSVTLSCAAPVATVKGGERPEVLGL